MGKATLLEKNSKNNPDLETKLPKAISPARYEMTYQAKQLRTHAMAGRED
jgi:hypothetical protein